MQEELASLTGELKFKFFFIKRNICGSHMHAFLSSVCISLTAFVSSHIPASIAFFLLLVLHVLVSIVLTENFKFLCYIYVKLSLIDISILIEKFFMCSR